MLNLLSLLSFMFGGNKKKKEENAVSSNFTTSSKPSSSAVSNMNRIGKGTIIEGDIIAEGSIRVEGVIKGNLNCKARVIIGTTGKVEGTVTCQEMEVMGNFNGTLEVKDLLILRSTAIVEGTITYNKLVVDNGAALSGQTIYRNTTKKLDTNKKFEQKQTKKAV